MTYLITNQNNFGHIAYPCPSYPKATVKSGGCGACAVLNCVENMTRLRFKMADWIDYVRANGGRIDGGTNITAILKALKRDYGFSYRTTNAREEAREHLAKGGMAVFHGGYGNVFSSAGHFVCLTGLNSSGEVLVIDSGWYAGKYSNAFRRSRVKDGSQQGLVISSWRYIEDDKKYKGSQGVSYYLITAPIAKEESEEEEMIYKDITEVPEWYKPAVQRRIDLGVFDGKNITETMCRIWTVEDRQRYRTLEDIPVGEFQDVISNLIHKGYIRGDGNGVLDLSQDMVRNYVINYRAGLYT
ncbi:MAG: hypothetical protein Q4C00_04895 [Bacillota bacterium]|nr:hypothetical protein [Bacillota bacterium]